LMASMATRSRAPHTDQVRRPPFADRVIAKPSKSDRE
jgi:hypothetical protein